MMKGEALIEIHHFFKRNNFIYLFVSLTTLLFISTVTLELPGQIGSDLFTIVTFLMIVVSVQSIKRKFNWKRTVHVLLIIFVIFAVLARFREAEIYTLLLLVTLLVFFIGTFTTAAKQVLFKGEVDSNKIIGSISLYMLLGLIWAMIYLILLYFDPKAISGIEAGNWQEIFASVAYYSFVTLTTLGYGDILPKNHLAEFFVYMEAIIGVFYMAIIVSSLVSMRLSALKKEKIEEKH